MHLPTTLLTRVLEGGKSLEFGSKYQFIFKIVITELFWITANIKDDRSIDEGQEAFKALILFERLNK